MVVNMFLCAESVLVMVNVHGLLILTVAVFFCWFGLLVWVFDLNSKCFFVGLLDSQTQAHNMC
ncbi:hypothetical protein HanRHA438_Chr16g0753401 [Helianthus annuus]|nr:hypothetical protein HanRHA438_Chr16g0753401 [Helianthus annuus]